MKDPAFLFYSSDFITGTMFMNNEEIGQYIKALCLLHQHNGKLPKDKIEIAVGKLSDNVLEKFELDDKNNLYNKRLLEETKKRNAFCASRKRNIQHRYKKHTYVEHTNIHMENENEDEDINKDKYLKKGIVKGKQEPKPKRFAYIPPKGAAGELIKDLAKKKEVL